MGNEEHEQSCSSEEHIFQKYNKKKRIFYFIFKKILISLF